MRGTNKRAHCRLVIFSIRTIIDDKNDNKRVYFAYPAGNGVNWFLPSPLHTHPHTVVFAEILRKTPTGLRVHVGFTRAMTDPTSMEIRRRVHGSSRCKQRQIDRVGTVPNQDDVHYVCRTTFFNGNSRRKQTYRCLKLNSFFMCITDDVRSVWIRWIFQMSTIVIVRMRLPVDVSFFSAWMSVLCFQLKFVLWISRENKEVSCASYSLLREIWWRIHLFVYNDSLKFHSSKCPF